jgi:hypothetical protein
LNVFCRHQKWSMKLLIAPVLFSISLAYKA